jgi:hypothetical protein
VTASSAVLQWGMHQRATYRWVAYDYTKLLRTQADTGKGLALLSVVVSSTFNGVFSFVVGRVVTEVSRCAVQEIVCRDCAMSFVFSAGEAAYFSLRELQPPKRCPACRKARHAAIAYDKKR